MASELFVSKEITINKSKKEVFDFLKFCKNQDKFSVWNMKDPNQKTTNSGTDGTVGFIYSWDSKDKNVGAGSQEIMTFKDNSIIEYELRFERPMKNTSFSRFVLTEISPASTKVNWEFRGPTKFPMSLFKGFFQKMLGKDLAKSLENLKVLMEK